MSSLLITAGAQAQTLADALCADSQEGVADPLVLRDAALADVSARALNANGDRTISAEEMFAAAVDGGFCDAPSRSRPCSLEDRRQLRAASNTLASFWKNHPGVTIRLVRAPSTEEIRAQPGLGAEPWAIALDEQRRFVEMRCSASTQAPDPSDDVTTPASRLNIGTFVLGKDLDSLTVQRGPVGTSDRLQKVAEAEVALETDRISKTRTISINGVAGLKLVDTPSATFIPYLQYTRTEVRDRTAGSRKVTGKLGVGAVTTAFFGDDQLDVAPIFARNTEHKSELLAARLVWRPGFLYRLPSFRSAWHFACSEAADGGCRKGSGLAIWTDAELIGSLGTVLREGDDPKLTDGREFVRAGGLASIHVYGLDGIFRDLSFDAAYKHLFRLSGDGRDVTSLKADVNWWVGGSEHVSLRYGYERSTDEETLERIQAWKLGLGVRF